MGTARSLALIDRSLLGNPGYCSLCAASIEADINNRLRAGWTAAQLQRWMSSKYHDEDGKPMSVDRRTIYRHQEHITHPADRLVTYVERAQKVALTEKPKTSAEKFLQAVTEVGMERVASAPEEVTIKDALQAAKTLHTKQETTQSLAMIFAEIVLGGPPLISPRVIEGEFTEGT